MDTQIVFKKSYSRDTTLYLQSLWAQGLTHRAREKFGWVNPQLPFVIHYVQDGVVEICEHTEAISWFLDTLLDENQKGDAFLMRLFDEYRASMGALKVLHAQGLLRSPDEWRQYRELVYRAAFDMTMFFYTGMDERSPQSSQDIAVHAREAGDFFADNDVFVRKNIASSAGISMELAGVVLPDEVDALPDQNVLECRLRASVLVDGESLFMGTREEFSKNEQWYIFTEEVIATDVSELKGQIACKGIVRGAVRIVKKQSDMAAVGAGDILVSPMTTPDFLPAMQKAAAFVTDEGGVTCHAAIVAREMQKPCIIGTKTATQVLKDGDLVEVDADTGVVRILKKAI